MCFFIVSKRTVCLIVKCPGDSVNFLLSYTNYLYFLFLILATLEANSIQVCTLVNSTSE